jgi:prepilin-type N-terminal cleavage/methylation domain-containing protein
MKKNIKQSNEKGFTIIEVLIVLAIAALILLIVFLAIPALQRSQRNNGRTSEATRLATQITDFVGSNNGILPGLEGTNDDTQAQTDAQTIYNNFGNFHSLSITGANTTTSNLNLTGTHFSGYVAGNKDKALPKNVLTVYNIPSSNAGSITLSGQNTPTATDLFNDAIGIFDNEKCGTSGSPTMTLSAGDSNNIAMVYGVETGATNATGNIYNYVCVQVQ